MIDLQKLRQNPEWFQKKIKEKSEDVDIENLLELDKQTRSLKTEIDELSYKRNQISKEIPQLQKNWENADQKMEEVKNIKKQIEQKQEEYNKLLEEFHNLYLQIPNPALDEVPIGADDEENIVARKEGKSPNFDFEPLPHYEILEQRDLLDKKRSANVSGTRFCYIKDGLVRLELALVSYAMDKLIRKWFRPIMWPNLVKKDSMIATGFFPAEENNIYYVNPDNDDLYLVGTSEVALVGQHLNEVLNQEDLPIRYVGFSPCYRREAGSYGKDTKWLIRVHQFEKVEMVSFTNPEDSIKEHNFLVEIEEEITQELGIHYQFIDICSGDTGFHAARKYDLEAWFPGMQTYKEITSCSNCTDFQARRGGIKYTDGQQKHFPHTLNWTAIALQRILACIVENYQTKDMEVNIPEVLKPYMDREKI